MLCPKCGKENDDNAVFCSSCGANLSQDNTISFEQLNGGAIDGGLERLKAEAKSAHLFGILSIIFCALGGFIGLIFAIVTVNKVNFLNTACTLPKDIKYIDEYEETRAKIKSAGKLAKIALIIFIISSILQIIISSILYANGIDIYSLMGF